METMNQLAEILNENAMETLKQLAEILNENTIETLAENAIETLAEQLLSDYPDDARTDHVRAVHALLRGYSVDEILGMLELDRWPETYVFLRDALNKLYETK